MPTDRANDPRAFQGFLDEKLTQGIVETLDEALSLWHVENLSEEDRNRTLEAIREGLADVEAGRVVSAREAIAELRQKHHVVEII
jgi:predicted transcriptional regulator